MTRHNFLSQAPYQTSVRHWNTQNQGWLRDEADSSNWFTSGEVAGTAGLSLRLEGIRIKLEKDE